MSPKKHQKPVAIEWGDNGNDAIDAVAKQAELYVLYLLSHEERLPSCGEDLCKLMLKDGSIILTGKWAEKPAMKKQMATNFGAHLESVLQGTRIEYDAQAAGLSVRPSAAAASNMAAAAAASASPATAGRKRSQHTSTGGAAAPASAKKPRRSTAQQQPAAAAAAEPLTIDSDDDSQLPQEAPAAAAAGKRRAVTIKGSGGQRGRKRAAASQQQQQQQHEHRTAADLPCLSPSKRPLLLPGAAAAQDGTMAAAAAAATPPGGSSEGLHAAAGKLPAMVENDDDYEQQQQQQQQQAPVLARPAQPKEQISNRPAAAAAAGDMLPGDDLGNHSEVDQHVSEDLAAAAAEAVNGQQHDGYGLTGSEETEPPSPPIFHSPAAAAAGEREGERFYSPEASEPKQQQQQQAANLKSRRQSNASTGGRTAAAAVAAGAHGIQTPAPAAAAAADSDPASMTTWQWQHVHAISVCQGLLAPTKAEGPKAAMTQQKLVSGLLSVPGAVPAQAEAEQLVDWMIDQGLVHVGADGARQFAASVTGTIPAWLSTTGTAGSSYPGSSNHMGTKPKPVANGTVHRIEGLDDRRLWKCATEVVRLVGLQDRRPVSQQGEMTNPNPSRLQVMRKSLDVAVLQYTGTYLGYNKELSNKAIDVCWALGLIDVFTQFDGTTHCRLKG